MNLGFVLDEGPFFFFFYSACQHQWENVVFHTSKVSDSQAASASRGGGGRPPVPGVAEDPCPGTPCPALGAEQQLGYYYE